MNTRFQISVTCPASCSASNCPGRARPSGGPAGPRRFPSTARRPGVAHLQKLSLSPSAKIGRCLSTFFHKLVASSSDVCTEM